MPGASRSFGEENHATTDQPPTPERSHGPELCNAWKRLP